jgi:hypothetical protein
MQRRSVARAAKPEKSIAVSMPCPRSMPIALGGPDGAARRRVRMAESSVGQPYKSPRRPDPSSKPPLPAMCDRVVLSSPLDRCAYLAKRHRIRTRQSQCGTREKCRLFHILVRWKGDSRPRSSRCPSQAGSIEGWVRIQPDRGGIQPIGVADANTADRFCASPERAGRTDAACVLPREHCRPQPDRAGRRAVAPVRIDVVESSARSNNPASILPSEEAVGHALAS